MKSAGNLSERSERAKELWARRREERERREEIARDQFLQDWLAQAEEVEVDIASHKCSDDEWEAIALHEGYRTARAWRAARLDVIRVLKHFIAADAFKALWNVFRKVQPAYDTVWGYTPARAGVPTRLLDALRTWHQAPKFTVAERRDHSKKIADACQVLEDLLAQLEPSHALDGQYSRFRFMEPGQARALLKAFSPDTSPKSYSSLISAEWLVSQKLCLYGIVPTWSVTNIKEMALHGTPGTNPLPAKVNAVFAKKTYFIGVVIGAIRSGSPLAEKEIEARPQLIADVVSLLADMDCNADDVRKHPRFRQPEDSESQRE